jgi:hypothetical protein
MKNWKLFLACTIVCAIPAWSQDQASSRPVIDNDNIGAATANSNVQDASAKEPAAAADTDAPEKTQPEPKKEEKQLSAKERLAKLKEKEDSWQQTIDIAQKHLETAENDNQRDVWRTNLDLAQKGLTDNRAEMKKVQAEADQEEQSAKPAATSENPPADTSTDK